MPQIVASSFWSWMPMWFGLTVKRAASTAGAAGGCAAVARVLGAWFPAFAAAAGVGGRGLSQSYARGAATWPASSWATVSDGTRVLPLGRAMMPWMMKVSKSGLPLQ